MEQFIESLDKVCMCVFCWVSYLIHQAFMAHKVWYIENMELILKEEKTQFYSEAQTGQKYAILCSVVMYMAKKWDEILISCNVNQWSL